MGLKTFITGGNGFIGSSLARGLLDEGVDVSLLVREPGTMDAGLRGGCRVLKGDITDKNSLAQIPDDIDIVFHLASYVHKVPRTDEEKQYVFNVNVDGTQNLLESLSPSVRHVVFFSSVSVYGLDSGEMIDETFSSEPITPYGQSKLVAEKYIAEWSRQRETMTTSLRLPMVYGPGNKGNMYRMIQAIDRGRFILLGKGENKRSMVHVGNVVEAALAAAQRQGPQDRVYIVTDGVDYTLRKLYFEISRALGKRPLPFHMPLPVAKALAMIGDLTGRPLPLDSAILSRLSETLTFSPRRLMDETGFEPQYNLSNSIGETVKWYESQKA